MNAELVEQTRRWLEDMLSFFEVNAKVTACVEGDAIELEVEADGGGRLIGHRGENLAAMQHMLNMLVRQRTEERIYVHVDIGGYRQARLEKLMEQAQAAADKAKADGEEVVLPMMNAAERRHIHSLMTDVEGVTTESRGDGNRRRLVVKPA